jgi:SAM-dependent methyltransferase
LTEDNSRNRHQLAAPEDAKDRLLMALVKLLLDKGVITEKELWREADPQRQQLVSEEEARRQWHTPALSTEDLAAKVSITADNLVLEAGSGFGGPARQLAEQFGCRVIGIDRDPLRVLHAIRQTAAMGLSDLVSFCWGVFENLPFPDECFDVVWAQESATSHDSEWDSAVPTGMDRRIFTEFRRVLKADGRLVCQVWIKGPLHDEDLPQFLDLVGFTLQAADDCTETWLASMRTSIEESKIEPDALESWRRSYQECQDRKDRCYRFVAGRRG